MEHQLAELQGKIARQRDRMGAEVSDIQGGNGNVPMRMEIVRNNDGSNMIGNAEEQEINMDRPVPASLAEMTQATGLKSSARKKKPTRSTYKSAKTEQPTIETETRNLAEKFDEEMKM